MLSYEDRRAKANTVSDKTKFEALDLLNKYNRCLIVRPTGIGKTYLLNAIAREYMDKYPNKSIIYLYPTDIIVNEEFTNKEYADIVHYLTFISFQRISLAFGSTTESDNFKSKSEDEKSAFIERQKETQLDILNTFKSASIVLIDEVHRIASEKLRSFFDMYDEEFEKVGLHIVGVTATIDRSDCEETDWIKNTLLKGKEVYSYCLGDAFNDEILLRPLIYRPVFNFDKQVENLAGELRAKKMNTSYFNDAELSQMIDNAKKSWGNNGKDIYNAIRKAGYVLSSDNPDDSFLRFIVFFSNTKHMVEEGGLIENYFRLATNTCASEDLGVEVNTELVVEYVISTTADVHNDMIVRDFCKEKDYRIYRPKSCDVCLEEKVVEENGVVSTVKESMPVKAHRVHLIFNVGTIIMGYHVPHISGVMQLSSVNTSIMFYQQIGRCLSVKNTKPSIIFDVVSNMLKAEKGFESNKNERRITERDLILGNMSISDREKRGDSLVEAVQTGVDTEATDRFVRFLGAMQDSSLLYTERIKWLYIERNMPIVFIAADLGVSCEEVYRTLLNMGIPLEDEQNEFKLLYDGLPKLQGDDNTKLDLKEKKSMSDYLMLGMLNSKSAHKLFTLNSKKKTKTLFESIAKYISKRF